MSKYDTGMAAEHFVLSVLYRMGVNATLTLGNKKSVDIVVMRASGDTVTIDVKGIAGVTSWPINDKRSSRTHYYVFVSFLGKIQDPNVSPEIYIVPSTSIRRLKYTHAKSGREFVQLSCMRSKSERYKDNWCVFN